MLLVSVDVKDGDLRLVAGVDKVSRIATYVTSVVQDVYCRSCLRGVERTSDQQLIHLP